MFDFATQANEKNTVATEWDDAADHVHVWRVYDWFPNWRHADGRGAQVTWRCHLKLYYSAAPTQIPSVASFLPATGDEEVNLISRY